ncbi:DNA polymerase epsilon subunit 4 [Phymastichus coffea]|uniref:DNA polymerase epsilon subunit 4 n=1 Tax=Phymastichus coffea TaxID=108790 RepID=UPI00273BDF0A|nr:DNA polymerase epsilon subunit 4 [Phymastichus coffea]
MANIQVQELNCDGRNLTADKTVGRNSQNSKHEQEEFDWNQVSIDSDDEIKTKLIKLPISRIRTIIKTDVEINLINREALFLIAKATELFIGALLKESYKYTYQSNKRTVQNQDLENAIYNVKALIFLDGM